MEEKEENQDFKAIGFQSILDCESHLIKLESWQNALLFLDEYFDSSLKEEEMIVRHYHASAMLFHIFYKDYGEILQDMQQLNHQMFDAEGATQIK